MTPKKVWGVVMIVIGVFMVFNGANKYYEAEFFGNEIKSLEKSLSRFGGNQFLDSKRYQQLLENEKNNGVAGFIIGIFTAIGGTLLLRNKKGKQNAKYSSRSCSSQMDTTVRIAKPPSEPLAEAKDTESSKWRPEDIKIS